MRTEPAPRSRLYRWLYYWVLSFPFGIPIWKINIEDYWRIPDSKIEDSPHNNVRRIVHVVVFLILMILFAPLFIRTVAAQGYGPPGAALRISNDDMQGFGPVAAAHVVYDVTMAIEPFIEQYSKGDITAETLDKKAKEIMAEHTDHPVARMIAPAVVYHKTLKALLEDRYGTEDILPYIAEHTEILVEFNSPHADDIAKALNALDGYWDEEKIQAAARKSVAVADSFLVGSVEHMGYELEDDPFNAEAQYSNEKTHTEIGSGIQSLEQLIEE